VNSKINSKGIIGYNLGGEPSALFQSFGNSNRAETNIINSTLTTEFYTADSNFNAEAINFFSGWGDLNIKQSTIQTKLFSKDGAGNTRVIFTQSTADPRNQYTINNSIISQLINVAIIGSFDYGSSTINIFKGFLTINNSKIDAVSNAKDGPTLIESQGSVIINNSILSAYDLMGGGGPTIFDVSYPGPFKTFNDICYINNQLVNCITS
jgi:hypothetical protein